MPCRLKSDGWNDMPIPPCVFLQSLRTGIPRRESGGFHWAIPKWLRNSKIKQRASARLVITEKLAKTEFFTGSPQRPQRGISCFGSSRPGCGYFCLFLSVRHCVRFLFFAYDPGALYPV